jgi:hypothetical protein
MAQHGISAIAAEVQVLNNSNSIQLINKFKLPELGLPLLQKCLFRWWQCFFIYAKISHSHNSYCRTGIMSSIKVKG